MDNHQILILGWPVSPVQKWLKFILIFVWKGYIGKEYANLKNIKKIFLSMYRNVYIQDG